ncbi:MAG: hypothetical protein LBT91_03000 [Bifidobacteriaceae bacterium]|jgi:hypothetical protein|nr:hypothetical protein [Bifidobacteriaceae bacterium]
MKFLKFRKLGILSIICLFSAALFLNGLISANASISQSVLGIVKGGTNANTVEEAQTNLGKINDIVENNSDTKFPSSKAVYDFVDFALNEKFIALGGTGASSYLAYSKDGIVWSQIANQNDFICANVSDTCGLEFGDNKYVIIGPSGTKISKAGMFWSGLFPMEDSLNFATMKYGENKFVAITTAGIPYISSDGQTWSQGNTTGVGAAQGLVFGDGKFVVVGSNSRINWSNDGYNWQTPITIGSGSTWREIAYANGKFVVVGLNSYISTSTDCITWTQPIQPADFTQGNLISITYGNGKFVAVGGGGPSTSGLLYYSEDGEIWNPSPNNKNYVQTNWNEVVYDGEKYVVVGYYGKTSYSYDGITWAAPQQITANNNNFRKIIFN